MTARHLCYVLGAICCLLIWRDCTRRPMRPPPAADVAECTKLTTTSSSSSSSHDSSSIDAPKPTEAPKDGLTMYGFHVPGYALRMLPQPGENLLAYRDRMMPLAQAAVAPQRARVARGREDFAAVANLDAKQKAELDAAVQEASTAIQDRVMNAALSGDFSPSTFKPMTGVTLARDVLDSVDRANKRFLGSLRPDQRDKLSQHPFDLADYLVFSTRWEDALGVSN